MLVKKNTVLERREISVDGGFTVNQYRVVVADEEFFIIGNVYDGPTPGEKMTSFAHLQAYSNDSSESLEALGFKVLGDADEIWGK